MYGIYTNIGGILMVNVTIYSTHGSYGNWFLENFLHQALLDATFGPGPRRAGLLRTRQRTAQWPLTEEGRRQLGVLVIPAARRKNMACS